MTETSSGAVHFEIIKSELESVRQEFAWLVFEISDEDWESKLADGAWTPKEEMVHIVQALEFFPKGITRAVEGSGWSLLSLVPSTIRGWINGYILIPMRSRKSTRSLILREYDKASKVLVDMLENLPEGDWVKGTRYPRGYRTVIQMAHRPKGHFEEHAAHLCSNLNISRRDRWNNRVEKEKTNATS